MDLIDKQAAIDAVLRSEALVRAYGYRYAADAVRELPAVQPEPVVRCKDCMHNGSFDTDCPINWNGKEYCSFAERRTDE